MRRSIPTATARPAGRFPAATCATSSWWRRSWGSGWYRSTTSASWCAWARSRGGGSWTEHSRTGAGSGWPGITEETRRDPRALRDVPAAGRRLRTRTARAAVPDPGDRRRVLLPDHPPAGTGAEEARGDAQRPQEGRRRADGGRHRRHREGHQGEGRRDARDDRERNGDGGGGTVAHRARRWRDGPRDLAGMSLLSLHLLGSPVLRQRSAGEPRR